MAFLKQVTSVWIFPNEVAGYGAALQQGFDRINIDSQMLNISGNPFDYRYRSPSSKLARMLVSWHRFGIGRGRVIRIALKVSSIPMRVLFVLFSFKRNTLIISLYGNSLLRGIDLLWARAMGACVVTVFLGSDSRPPYLNGVKMNVEGDVDLARIFSETKRVNQSVRKAEKNSDLVICSPSTAHFLRKDFINWFYIGMPNTEYESVDVAQRAILPDSVIRITHAPSRPKCKGTNEIQGAIEELKKEGFKIDFTLLQNVPNLKVKSTLMSMDLVIDELYSDTFMGGLGSEAAAAGVPCLTFGFAEDELALWFNPSKELMNGYSDPSKLKQKIIWAIQDVEGRKSLAGAQRTFQRDFWDSTIVANRYLELASGKYPKKWTFHPSDVNYFWGAGIPKERLTHELKSYVMAYGQKGFFLNRDSQIISRIFSI